MRNSNGAPGREGAKEEESPMRKASGLGMGVVVVLAAMLSLIVGYTQEARGVVAPSQIATLPDVEAGPGETVQMPVWVSRERRSASMPMMTFPPAFLTNLQAAKPVPPVAIISSTITTKSSFTIASFCISI